MLIAVIELVVLLQSVGYLARCSGIAGASIDQGALAAIRSGSARSLSCRKGIQAHRVVSIVLILYNIGDSLTQRNSSV